MISGQEPPSITSGRGPRGEHEAPAVVIAAMVMGTAAYFAWQLEPILLNGLKEAGRLSEAGIGQVAMIETVGLAIGSFVGPGLLKERIRVKIAIACVLFMMANLAIIRANSTPIIMFDRGVAGLIAGFIAASANVILAHNSRPGFVSGLMIAFIAVPQAAAGYFLPAALIPHYGINAAYGLIVLVTLVALAMTPLLIDHVAVAHEHAHGRVVRTPALLAAVVAIVLQMAGTGAAWNYLGLLGSLRGITDVAMGFAFSGSLVVSAVALLIGAFLSLRLVPSTTLIVGALVQAAVTWAIVTAFGSTQFIISVAAFGAFASMQAFMVNELVRLDPTRKTAALVNPVVQIGMSVGPLLGSLVVFTHDVSRAFYGAVVFFLVSVVLYAFAGRQRSSEHAAALPHPVA